MCSRCISVLLWLTFCVTPIIATKYDVDISQGLGRRFDGVGGLSGGATSKLLVNYAEPFRSQILDYLFKPNFAASLQILKVEIGGDAQSTDGTESSHMHAPWDEEYDRGYEWWLMVEAKKRNPDIKLYALPWAFPGWLGNETPYGDPYNTATYILKWVAGAKKHYNLDIDYLGIWNERNCNITYVKVLRDVLNKNGYSNIKLVVADGGWTVSVDMLKDEVLSQAVDYIGTHYPGTNTIMSALQTGKQLWASEDYSTFNDNVGAGCWARLLNQNYVNGFMTSTISWNLIASYYEALPFGRDGLMTAQEPWSGHYVVQAPIWITAHTTQFASPGWSYLRHGAGVGKLMNGGSYVSLVDPVKNQFTMVIETMSHEHSLCIRPKLPAYNTSNQTVTFQLRGKLGSLSKLYLWYSELDFSGKKDSDILFKSLAPLEVNNGSFTLKLGVDELYTLTTIYRTPQKLYTASPQSQPFPVPYQDNFESYALNSEAYNFAPQAGVWEVRDSGDKDHGKVNRQVILDKPCYWCDTGAYPINVGGNYAWKDIAIEMDVRVPSVNGTDAVFLAGRVSKGGCGVADTKGVFYSLRPGSKEFRLTSDLQLSNIIVSGSMNTTFAYDHWYNLKLTVWGDTAYGYLNGNRVFMMQIPVLTPGFVAYGCASYGLADYDNLQILPV